MLPLALVKSTVTVTFLLLIRTRPFHLKTVKLTDIVRLCARENMESETDLF